MILNHLVIRWNKEGHHQLTNWNTLWLLEESEI